MDGKQTGPNKCNVEGCHEGIKMCVKEVKHSMVQKKVLWAICWGLFVVVHIPVGITGIKVWSQQESDNLRYVPRADLDSVRNVQTEVRTKQNRVLEDLRELKAGQAEARKDMKEIRDLLMKK